MDGWIEIRPENGKNTFSPCVTFSEKIVVYRTVAVLFLVKFLDEVFISGPRTNI